MKPGRAKRPRTSSGGPSGPDRRTASRAKPNAGPEAARKGARAPATQAEGETHLPAPQMDVEAKADAERGPLRRCVATREVGPKERMIRFVLAPASDGGTPTLVPDLAGRLPGRGLWLSARGDVLERALSRGAFLKAARGPILIPAGLAATIEDGLRRRVLDLVGFARRAGQAVVGFQQVREWLQAGRAAVLVEAMDGSPAERARLIGGSDATVVAALTAAELGGVFGRDHAVHVAVAPGRLAQAIVAEAARWRGIATAGDEAPRTGGEDRAAPGAGKNRPPRGGRKDVPPDGGGNEAPPGGAGQKVPLRGADSRAPLRGADNRAPLRGDGHGAPPRGARNGAPPSGDGRTGQVQGIE